MSNYEITKKRVQKEFAHYDHEKMIQRFHLESDEKYLYMNFLNRRYRIHRVSGNVEWLEKETAWEAGFNEVLTLLDVLCDSKEGCIASGEFVNMQSMSAIKGSTGNVGGNYYQADAKLFNENKEKLSRACEYLQGIPKGKGDVAYEIPVFAFLSFRIQFWEADEEFSESLEIFVDKNTLQFMRYETMWYAVSHMLERVKEEMGI